MLTQLNRCEFFVSGAAGTGDITVGAATNTDRLTPAEAGAQDGVSYRWCVTDGSDFEIFEGVYNSSGPTLTRGTVEKSKIGGSAGTSRMNLAGGETVFAAPSAADFPADEEDWGLITGAVDATDDYGSIA